jgi:hypothetical protein
LEPEQEFEVDLKLDDPIMQAVRICSFRSGKLSLTYYCLLYFQICDEMDRDVYAPFRPQENGSDTEAMPEEEAIVSSDIPVEEVEEEASSTQRGGKKRRKKEKSKGWNSPKFDE